MTSFVHIQSPAVAQTEGVCFGGSPEDWKGSRQESDLVD